MFASDLQRATENCSVKIVNKFFEKTAESRCLESIVTNLNYIE